jgi:hypothetical protein
MRIIGKTKAVDAAIPISDVARCHAKIDEPGQLNLDFGCEDLQPECSSA